VANCGTQRQFNPHGAQLLLTTRETAYVSFASSKRSFFVTLSSATPAPVKALPPGKVPRGGGAYSTGSFDAPFDCSSVASVFFAL
jgi:hypothetical protein